MHISKHKFNKQKTKTQKNRNRNRNRKRKDKNRTRRHKLTKRQIKINYRNKGKGIKNESDVQCCMCEKTCKIVETFVPQSCFRLNYRKAHRICDECWWNKFAQENASHKCPGCIKHFPLTNISDNTSIIEISDSDSDSDSDSN